MTHTIALNNDNEFEFLASVLATWDETSDGVLHKRHALDQLLIRSEIDGYKKTKSETGGIIIWDNSESNIVVHMQKRDYGLWDVCIISHNIEVTVRIREL